MGLLFIWGTIINKFKAFRLEELPARATPAAQEIFRSNEMSTSPKRDLVRELDRSMPAASHAKLGTAFDALQKAHNALADVIINPTKLVIGSPIALDADYLLKACTSTNLPNNATKTFTTATDNTPPLDGVVAAPDNILMSDATEHLVWTLDVPRNITSVTTHGSSIVAMTVLISGFDHNKAPISELLTIGAGTAGPTEVDGKKAFKYVESIAIASAGNATTNTLNIGIGNVLGLPYLLAEKDDFLACFFNHGIVTPTIVVADVTSPVTNVTGDPRGTIATTASDGSKISVWMNIGVDNTAFTVTPLSEL